MPLSIFSPGRQFAGDGQRGGRYEVVPGSENPITGEKRVRIDGQEFDSFPFTPPSRDDYEPKSNPRSTPDKRAQTFRSGVESLESYSNVDRLRAAGAKKHLGSGTQKPGSRFKRQ